MKFNYAYAAWASKKGQPGVNFDARLMSDETHIHTHTCTQTLPLCHAHINAVMGVSLATYYATVDCVAALEKLVAEHIS